MIYKQYILINTQEIFPIGKIMAHVGHGVLTAHSNINTEKQRLRWNLWISNYNQTKIVLEVDSIEKIENIIKKADRMGIPTSFIEDIHIKKKIVGVIGPIIRNEAIFLGLLNLRLYK